MQQNFYYIPLDSTGRLAAEIFGRQKAMQLSLLDRTTAKTNSSKIAVFGIIIKVLILLCHKPR
jgi:hypothetical protein